jgi:2,3-diketo-5-methylthio-1-phosphopentane phosphatase
MSDFDGTISKFDMAELVLTKFAKGDWKIYDRQLERGEITLEECINRQFSTVVASRREIIETLDKAADFRPGFGALVGFCQERRIPIVIVSAGIDFVIEHFAKVNGWQGVKIYAGRTTINGDSIKFDFPPLKEEGSANFKDDLVLRYKRTGRAVVYIGDGLSDFNAVEKADFIFAVAGSRLAKRCEDVGIERVEFNDFKLVVEALKDKDF